MRLGELKPKGSGKTFQEWFRLCLENSCKGCIYYDECDSTFYDVRPYELEYLLDFKVEV